MPRTRGVEKKPTVIHLTPEAKGWLDRLSKQNGISNSVQVEKLIRLAAVEENYDGAREWK